MSQAALINPTILTWSRERAGLTAEDVAKKLPTKPDRVLEWEAGESRPTFRQAQHWANIAHVPFGFLFLKEPPSESLPLPDLRTLGGVPPERPSLNLLDTVKDVLRKQDWYLEYLQDQERDPLPFVGKFTTQTSVKEVVADIRRILAVDPEASRLNYDAYVRTLIEAAERAGILVMRSGIAVGNTHRKLDVAEFRGFAISNALAPIVFINSADADTARLFTLMHELAHIWIGSSGVSDGGNPGGRREEVFCNAVAGEFLAPEEEFRAAWKDDIDWHGNLAPLAARFHVSNLVIGRRARDLGYISNDQYGIYYRQTLRLFQDKEGGGGDYYRTAKAKNSTHFSKAVLTETMSGRMLLRDAGRLLGVQPANLRTYANKLTE
ncbi:XRE family transcriptional regulator [Pseudomonas corrugata]|uniref:XRE family transcriptional regulator n=1 Tax=Pseudomonas corrugata TaxID=47879 RepID=UPI0004B171F2|nr:XRE family transcriptional regulator [Pseudomonas corrugata]MDU9026197.1 XRE family transcriptional regulator [Pseudomonas corrugata]MDU9042829.1 XRE family transcriptional regulator [Pseudomonas corrugata]